jgi:hypothetical protein
MLGFCNALRTPEIHDETLGILKSCSDMRALFGTLHREGICLPLQSFAALAGLDKAARPLEGEVRAVLVDLFDKADQDAERSERLCGNGTYDGTISVLPAKVASAVHSLRSGFSLFPEEAYGRIMGRATSEGLGIPTLEKSAGEASPQAGKVAEEYAAYLVSFANAAEGVGTGHKDFVLNLTALRALV